MPYSRLNGNYPGLSNTDEIRVPTNNVTYSNAQAPAATLFETAIRPSVPGTLTKSCGIRKVTSMSGDAWLQTARMW